MNTKYFKINSIWQEKLVFAVDVFIIAICYIAAYFIRFDGVLPAEYLNMMWSTLPVVLLIRMGAVVCFKLNSGMRQYASIKDLSQIIKAVSVSSVIIITVTIMAYTGQPRSIFIIDWLLLIIALSGVRFIIRMSRPYRIQKNGNNNGRKKKVLIMGAGDAGEMLLREMLYHYSYNYEVVGLIDDDPEKHKKCIHGVTVLGKRTDIPEIVRRYDIEEIVIAIPTLKPGQMRDIVNYCILSGAKYRTIPNLSNIVNGTVKIEEIREVKLDDLLNRKEVILNSGKFKNYIQGKRVLITGAGGSIGSELCRQVARLSPAKLILFEKAENSLFYIDMELEQSFINLKKIPVIGNICDKKKVAKIFMQYKPQIVFHAAAYKHVPLMETNSMEAIRNNVFGTKIIAEESIRCNVERFIMLSTDKAVDPTSLMGVSKRVAEIYVSALARVNGTKFMAVRFGNVMGSEGSVIPIFKKQIANGWPVTITHPDIKRYFMTIPEAAGLVIEAGSMGQGGEIFILEMGKQEKIIDIAKDLIRLSGKEPEKDIEIKITGLRPGEKMHEALIGIQEKIREANHKKIFIIESEKENGRNIFNDIKRLEEIMQKI